MKCAKQVRSSLVLLLAACFGMACSDMRQGHPDARSTGDSPAEDAQSRTDIESSAPVLESSSEPAPAPVSPLVQSPLARRPGGERIDPHASAETGASSAEMPRARALVLSHLRDPATARFRFEREVQDGQIICMEVSSQDGSGGEIGFTQAVVILRPGAAPVVWVDDVRQHVARAACEMA